MKFEMHLHTADSNDPVANIPAAELVELYHARGYDGIVFTDHFSEEAMDWLSPETKGFNHNQILDRWLKSYRSAKEVGDRVLFIDGGIILEQNNPRDFFAHPQHPRTQDFLSKVLF